LGTKDTQILVIAYHLMQKKLTQAWITRTPEVPYKTPYEALIAASLIEREAIVPAERPLIAGVIVRRLKIGMRLQMDSSVLYGLTDKSRRTLTQHDLITDTPYNIYMRNGLPPTPIAMPGIASIDAALHPAAKMALYFMAKGDGTHIFSETFQDHKIAAQAYKQQLRAIQREAHYLPAYLKSTDSLPTQCFSAELLLNYWLRWNK